MDKVAQNASLNDRLEELIEKTREGNKQAYKTLLDMVAILLRRILYRPLNAYSQQGALEDIVQETLLAIHLKLHTYDREQPFLAWLRIIAKHKMIDYLRRQKKNTYSINEDHFGDIEDTGELPDSMAARDLNTLLSQLRPPAGDLIYGLKIEGASIKDLAEKFAMSEANVKVMVHRGLQKLSDIVRGQ